MSQVETSHSQPDELLDEFAAEVTRVAYPVALKYGVSGSSLDLELEIWKTITELVRRRGKELFFPPSADQALGARCC
jgi:hypothetical protein